jgi:hypothetical protein
VFHYALGKSDLFKSITPGHSHSHSTHPFRLPSRPSITLKYSTFLLYSPRITQMAARAAGAAMGASKYTGDFLSCQTLIQIYALSFGLRNSRWNSQWSHTRALSSTTPLVKLNTPGPPCVLFVAAIVLLTCSLRVVLSIYDCAVMCYICLGVCLSVRSDGGHCS